MTKSIQSIKFLLVLAVSIFSSLSFGSEHEVKLTQKLGDIFDSAIIGEGLSKANLAALKSGKAFQVEIDGEMHSFAVVAAKESGTHLTSFKRYFSAHTNSERTLDCQNGAFMARYNYTNIYSGNVVYRLAFRSPIISELCQAPQEVVALQDLTTTPSAQVAPVPVVEVALAPVKESSSSVSQASPNESYDDSCDEFSSSVCSATPMALRGPSLRIALLSSTLGDVSRIMARVLKIGAEADHLWVAAANGARGFMGLYDAVTTFSLTSAACAIPDLASAAVGAARAYSSICGISPKTQELFKKLDGKLDLITSISDEMSDVVQIVRTSLAQVDEALNQNLAQKEHKKAFLEKATKEQAEAIKAQLAILERAHQDIAQASIDLHKISAEIERIEKTWKEVTGDLEKLEESVKEPLDEEVDKKAQIEDRLEFIQEFTANIRAKVQSLQEPMALVSVFIAKMTRLNQAMGGHFSDAITQIGKMSSKNAELETICSELRSEILQLREAQCELAKMKSQVALLSDKAEKLKVTSDHAKASACELKTAVDAKYDFVHLFVGALTAVTVVTVVSTGALPAAGLGLFACHAAKVVDLGRNGCNAAEPQFKTKLGRLFYLCGVSESIIKRVGSSVLRIDYAALDAAINEATDKILEESDKK